MRNSMKSISSSFIFFGVEVEDKSGCSERKEELFLLKRQGGVVRCYFISLSKLKLSLLRLLPLATRSTREKGKNIVVFFF